MSAPDTLETVAGKINAFLRKSDQQRISAGRLLIEARQRVEAGEAGEGIGWQTWCQMYVQRSQGDIRKIMALAGADDPEAALDKEREARRASMAKQRRQEWEEDQDRRAAERAASRERSHVGAVDDPSAGMPGETEQAKNYRLFVEALGGFHTEPGQPDPQPVFCGEVAMMPAAMIPALTASAYCGKSAPVDVAWAWFHASPKEQQEAFLEAVTARDQHYKPRVQKAQAWETIKAAWGRLPDESVVPAAAWIFQNGLTVHGLKGAAEELYKRLSRQKYKALLHAICAAMENDTDMARGFADEMVASADRQESAPEIIEADDQVIQMTTECVIPLFKTTQASLDANELLNIFTALKPNSRKCALRWIETGCPSESDPNEHHRITEALIPFRSTASKLPPKALQLFIEFVADRAAA